MIGHGVLAAIVDRAEQFDNLIGLDVARLPMTAERVGDLVEALLSIFPRWLPRILERLHISLEEVAYAAEPGVAGDLDAAPLLDDVGVVALEDFACLGERYRWVRADLFPAPFAISPLLGHPVGGHARWHGLQHQYEPASAAALAISEGLLRAVQLDPLYGLPDRRIGKTCHPSHHPCQTGRGNGDAGVGYWGGRPSHP